VQLFREILQSKFLSAGIDDEAALVTLLERKLDMGSLQNDLQAKARSLRKPLIVLLRPGTPDLNESLFSFDGGSQIILGDGGRSRGVDISGLSDEEPSVAPSEVIEQFASQLALKSEEFCSLLENRASDLCSEFVEQEKAEAAAKKAKAKAAAEEPESASASASQQPKVMRRSSSAELVASKTESLVGPSSAPSSPPTVSSEFDPGLRSRIMKLGSRIAAKYQEMLEIFEKNAQGIFERSVAPLADENSRLRRKLAAKSCSKARLRQQIQKLRNTITKLEKLNNQQEEPKEEMESKIQSLLKERDLLLEEKKLHDEKMWQLEKALKEAETSRDSLQESLNLQEASFDKETESLLEQLRQKQKEVASLEDNLKAKQEEVEKAEDEAEKAKEEAEQARDDLVDELSTELQKAREALQRVKGAKDAESTQEALAKIQEAMDVIDAELQKAKGALVKAEGVSDEPPVGQVNLNLEEGGGDVLLSGDEHSPDSGLKEPSSPSEMPDSVASEVSPSSPLAQLSESEEGQGGGQEVSDFDDLFS